MNSFLTFYRLNISKEVTKNMLIFFITSTISLSTYLLLTFPNDQDALWDKAISLNKRHNSYIALLEQSVDEQNNTISLLKNLKLRMNTLTPVYNIYYGNKTIKDSIVYYKKILAKTLKQNSEDIVVINALRASRNKSEDAYFAKLLESEKNVINNMLDIVASKRNIDTEDNKVYNKFTSSILVWSKYKSITVKKEEQQIEEKNNTNEIKKLLKDHRRLNNRLVILLILTSICAFFSLLLIFTALKVGHLKD